MDNLQILKHGAGNIFLARAHWLSAKMKLLRNFDLSIWHVYSSLDIHNDLCHREKKKKECEDVGITSTHSRRPFWARGTPDSDRRGTHLEAHSIIHLSTLTARTFFSTNSDRVSCWILPKTISKIPIRYSSPDIIFHDVRRWWFHAGLWWWGVRPPAPTSCQPEQD